MNIKEYNRKLREMGLNHLTMTLHGGYYEAGSYYEIHDKRFESPYPLTSVDKATLLRAVEAGARPMPAEDHPEDLAFVCDEAINEFNEFNQRHKLYGEWRHNVFFPVYYTRERIIKT